MKRLSCLKPSSTVYRGWLVIYGGVSLRPRRGKCRLAQENYVLRLDVGTIAF